MIKKKTLQGFFLKRKNNFTKNNKENLSEKSNSKFVCFRYATVSKDEKLQDCFQRQL